MRSLFCPIGLRICSSHLVSRWTILCSYIKVLPILLLLTAIPGFSDGACSSRYERHHRWAQYFVKGTVKVPKASSVTVASHSPPIVTRGTALNRCFATYILLGGVSCGTLATGLQRVPEVGRSAHAPLDFTCLLLYGIYRPAPK